MTRTYTTTDILAETKVPFWRLEHLIRAHRIKPLNKGRGRERRFSQEEYEKAKRLLSEGEVIANHE